jgi:hypothetical protein
MARPIHVMVGSSLKARLLGLLSGCQVAYKYSGNAKAKAL